MASELIIIAMAVMLGCMKKLGTAPGAETNPEKRGWWDARSSQMTALVSRAKPTLNSPYLACPGIPQGTNMAAQDPASSAKSQ